MNFLDMLEEDYTSPDLITLDELLARFEADPPQRIAPEHPYVITIDTESEHYHWFKPNVNAFCFTISWTKEHTYYIQIEDEEEAATALLRLINYGGLVVFHNMKYDMHVINKICRKTGIFLDVNWNRLHCTMLMSHVLDENRTHGLKELSDGYGIQYDEGVDASKLKEDVKAWLKEKKEFTGIEHTHADVPKYLMVPYAVQDAYLTREIFIKFYFEIVNDPKRDELLNVYNIERQLSRVLFNAEERGVRVDMAFVYEQIGSLTPQVTMMIEECERMGEMTSFNPLAVDDVAKFLKKFDLFNPDTMINPETGKVNLPEDVLELVDHPIAQKVLTCRLYSKLLSAYFNAIDDFHHEDAYGVSTVNCNFRQIGARTGRMSITEPALQTLPKEKGNVRGAFIARDGHQLIFADYASQELRILAHYTKSYDPGIAKAIMESDLHTEAAIAINNYAPGTDKKDIAVEHRKKAKGFNFAIVYGAGVKKLKALLKAETDDQAQVMLDNYHKRFPGIKWLKNTSAAIMERRGYVTTTYGRRHRIIRFYNKDGTPRMKFGRPSTNSYKSSNSLIQGTAADMAKSAMVKLDGLFRAENMKAIIILQVHDEIIVEAPDEEVERAKVLIDKAMTDCPEISIPMEVDIHTARRWSEAID